tara:strand:- start:874 stop:1248 length:375 start_codon:yes stop_codon:yes gene_type:complete
LSQKKNGRRRRRSRRRKVPYHKKQKQKKEKKKSSAKKKRDELPNVHAEKVVDVFQSGTLGETTARAEKENADRAASRKKSRGKGREGRGGGNVIGKGILVSERERRRNLPETIGGEDRVSVLGV